ncbi:MAG TPA: hypothetical protein VF763_13565 [Candidatus Limnocylindrales bacterium]
MKRLLLADDFAALALVWLLALGVAFMLVCLARSPHDRPDWPTSQSARWVVQADTQAPTLP